MAFAYQLQDLLTSKAVRIFVMFMLMSAFLAMFIDSITVILFLSPRLRSNCRKCLNSTRAYDFGGKFSAQT